MFHRRASQIITSKLKNGEAPQMPVRSCGTTHAMLVLFVSSPSDSFPLFDWFAVFVSSPSDLFPLFDGFAVFVSSPSGSFQLFDVS